MGFLCIFSHRNIFWVAVCSSNFSGLISCVGQKVRVGCMCPKNLKRNLYNCPLTQCMKLHTLEWAFLLVFYWESGRKIPFVLWWGFNLCANVVWASREWETKHGEGKKKKKKTPPPKNTHPRRIKETWTLIFIKASHISCAFQQHVFDEITQQMGMKGKLNKASSSQKCIATGTGLQEGLRNRVTSMGLKVYRYPLILVH